MKTQNTKHKTQIKPSANGYAALSMMVLTLVVSLSIVGSFTFFSLKEVAANRSYTKSIESRYVSEGGVEDAVYRILTGKQISASETLNVGTGSTTILVASVGNQRIVRSEGKRDTYQQNLEAKVNVAVDAVSFYYGVQVGAGGLSMGNNSRINGSVYSNGNITGSNGATITGDAIVTGGISTNPAVEWTANDIDHFFATSTANRDVAQSFTGAAGPLNRVSILLAKVGNPSANLSIHITTDNNGKPSSSALASATIPPSVVGGAPAWIDASFASPPTLANGVKYWIVLDYGSNSTVNYWNWREDANGGYAGNVAKHTSNWSSGGSAWTDIAGDLAFRVWIGGANTRIEGMIIGDNVSGSGRANLFVNSTIHGSACPNQYCIIDNPAAQNLPIAAEVIQGWRDEAAAGGTCAPPQCDSSGNLNVSGTVTLGPKKIAGNLKVDNGATLIISGTLWVLGDITLSNGCVVRLASSYGTRSGLILGDDDITVSNNCEFQGSGSAGSYFMLLSDKNTPTSDAIVVDNNSLGVIYYASRGRIHFSNNATAKEATGYGITLDNNAVITYESGLQDVTFTSGPSGGYELIHWKRVE